MSDLEVGMVDASQIPDNIGVPDRSTGERDETPAGWAENEKSLLEMTGDDWKTDDNKLPDYEKTEEKKEPVVPEKEEPEQTEEVEEEAPAKTEDVFNYNRWKMLMEAAGVKLPGDTPEEMLDAFESSILQAHREKKGAPPQSETKPTETRLGLPEVFEKYGKQLEFTPELKEFYGDLVGLVAGAATDVLNQHLSQMGEQLHMTQARNWYMAAKTENGDDPFPSFREAFSLLTMNPEYVQRAQDRFTVFGDVEFNPMSAIADKWRAMKSPDGLTKGEKAKRDQEALKVKRLKATAKPTRIPAAPKGASERLSDMASMMEKIGWDKF